MENRSRHKNVTIRARIFLGNTSMKAFDIRSNVQVNFVDPFEILVKRKEFLPDPMFLSHPDMKLGMKYEYEGLRNWE